MIFYLTIVPGAFLVLIMFFSLLKDYNHNNALYRFCDLRRDIMQYLIKNEGNISLAEFNEIKGILNQSSDTIHYFKEMKISFFKFQIFKDVLRGIAEGLKKSEQKKYSYESSERFAEGLSGAYIKAFFKIVPFFKWKLSAHIMTRVASFLFSLGYETLLNTYSVIKDREDKHNMHDNYQMA